MILCRRRSLLSALTAVITVTAVCKAQRTPALVDTLGSALEQTETLFNPDFRRLAPIVVVASVSKNEIVIQNKPAARIPGVSLDLHLVHCRLENTLRGKIDGPEFSFYYYGQHSARGWNPFYSVLFRAEPAKRYIFFLVRENGVLRSIGDVGEYCIEVWSGAHPAYISPAVKDGWIDQAELGRAVADILLKKGEGAATTNAKAFAFYIQSSVNLANRWGSLGYNIRLLRDLLSEPEPFRESACRALVKYYDSQYDCLYQLRDDTSKAPETREYARTELEHQKNKDVQIIENLRDPASLVLPAIGESRDRRVIFEELESLRSSPNDEIRKGACIAIRRYYPNETGCAP